MAGMLASTQGRGSGTTATAHALELLGLQIGQDLDSHREPRGLQKLHEDYLRKLGAAWYSPP